MSRFTLTPRHGHCDGCGRCAQDYGAQGSRVRSVGDRQLRDVGWTVVGGRIYCPCCQGGGDARRGVRAACGALCSPVTRTDGDQSVSIDRSI